MTFYLLEQLEGLQGLPAVGTMLGVRSRGLLPRGTPTSLSECPMDLSWVRLIPGRGRSEKLLTRRTPHIPSLRGPCRRRTWIGMSIRQLIRWYISHSRPSELRSISDKQRQRWICRESAPTRVHSVAARLEVMKVVVDL